VLEKIDRLIADIWTAARTGVGDRLYFVLVSDHGSSAVSKEIRLNVALRQAGLLTVDEAKGRLTAWQAWAAKGHGMAAVYLKEPKDDQLRRKVALPTRGTGKRSEERHRLAMSALFPPGAPDGQRRVIIGALRLIR
jgi:Type I phosphodiesterase / nucleotide pyrophosphatase